MADLSRSDRGQIILLAAFALAVIFVVLALIVNSAIYSENLATRGETAGSDDGLDMRAMVEANVGEAVAVANRRNASAGYAGLEDAVQASVRNVSTQTGYQQARTGRVVEVTYQSKQNGVRIVHNESDGFESSGGATDYELAGDVERVSGGNGTRAFRINASSIAATSNSSAFEVKVNESGAVGNRNSWRMRLYRDGTDTVHVRTIRNESGTNRQEDCEVTVDSASPTFRVDVTEGTIDDEPCDALRTTPDGRNFHFGSGTGVDPGTNQQYDIYFKNADQISGNFSLVVYDDGNLVLPNLGLIGSGQPFNTDALYEVTVRYTYETANMRYETDVRVAPGEPDA